MSVAKFQKILDLVQELGPNERLKLEGEIIKSSAISAYDNGLISLGKLAEILECSYDEVIERLKAECISLKTGPETLDEIYTDADNA